MTEVRGSDVRTPTFRPRSPLFGQLAIATVVLTVPVFAALYWISVPVGVWPAVLALQVLVMLIIGVGVIASRSVYVQLHEWGVEDHWPFGFTSNVRSSDVDTILLIDLYTGNGMETVPQLFALDGRDRLVLRMRGQLWTRSAIQQVAARLGAPVVHAPVPMTLTDFTRIEPQLLAWFERRPLWAVRAPRTLATSQDRRVFDQ
ncbi:MULTISPECIES: hypothetical protein [unclassified Leifsonia]|uniref:hypothetical protein n=1 Tax=unclassified Leifsonia TaxID=2663824 RepID=UPI0006FCAA6F|nr:MULTISPECIES: hypothetical protein [unclassified Leifsonia]KQX05633.1 hypothetical protein ASC59_16270 [Leifsonia sp. Root1293]KRA09268.1 hypothetical protein ASD61_16265 [Leifsonia sp. Root60]